MSKTQGLSEEPEATSKPQQTSPITVEMIARAARDGALNQRIQTKFYAYRDRGCHYDSKLIDDIIEIIKWCREGYDEVSDTATSDQDGTTSSSNPPSAAWVEKWGKQ